MLEQLIELRETLWFWVFIKGFPKDTEEYKMKRWVRQGMKESAILTSVEIVYVCASCMCHSPGTSACLAIQKLSELSLFEFLWTFRSTTESLASVDKLNLHLLSTPMEVEGWDSKSLL